VIRNAKEKIKNIIKRKQQTLLSSSRPVSGVILHPRSQRLALKGSRDILPSGIWRPRDALRRNFLLALCLLPSDERLPSGTTFVDVTN